MSHTPPPSTADEMLILFKKMEQRLAELENRINGQQTLINDYMKNNECRWFNQATFDSAVYDSIDLLNDRVLRSKRFFKEQSG